MKFQHLSTALAGLVFIASSLVNTANAGMITDTANNSFIDETTGLEWMDFGINNIHSYNEVVSLLDTTYAGWSLATESEAIALWQNAFSGKGSTKDETFATGSWYGQYDDDGGNGDSIHEAVFDAMGTNIWGRMASGWFEDTTGGMSYVFFEDLATGNDVVNAYGRDIDYSYYRTVDHTAYSTMLVKRPAAGVPEPSTFAIFALAMFGLSLRRLSKQ